MPLVIDFCVASSRILVREIRRLGGAHVGEQFHAGATRARTCEEHIHVWRAWVEDVDRNMQVGDHERISQDELRSRDLGAEVRGDTFGYIGTGERHRCQFLDQNAHRGNNASSFAVVDSVLERVLAGEAVLGRILEGAVGVQVDFAILCSASITWRSGSRDWDYCRCAAHLRTLGTVSV